MGGQAGSKAASLAWLTADFKRALVASQNMLDDGETQAGAAGFA